MAKTYQVVLEENEDGNLWCRVPRDVADELGWHENDEFEARVEDGKLIVWKVV